MMRFLSFETIGRISGIDRKDFEKPITGFLFQELIITCSAAV